MLDIQAEDVLLNVVGKIQSLNVGNLICDTGIRRIGAKNYVVVTEPIYRIQYIHTTHS